MKLHFNPASPFVRMVRVTAHEVGVQDQLELVPTGVLLPVEAHDAVVSDSPLGKIPTLVTDHGSVLYDSRVICEYLAHHGGDKVLFPDEPVSRFRALTIQALAQGLADAAVSYRYETTIRPAERQWDKWAARQLERINAGLDDLENTWIDDLEAMSIGTISAAVVPSYLDFRMPDFDWRSTRPKLSGFYDAFRQRPSMKTTELDNPV